MYVVKYTHKKVIETASEPPRADSFRHLLFTLSSFGGAPKPLGHHARPKTPNGPTSHETDKPTSGHVCQGPAFSHTLRVPLYSCTPFITGKMTNARLT